MIRERHKQEEPAAGQRGGSDVPWILFYTVPPRITHVRTTPSEGSPGRRHPGLWREVAVVSARFSWEIPWQATWAQLRQGDDRGAYRSSMATVACPSQAKRGGCCGFGAHNTEGPGRVPQPVALPCDVSSQDFAVARAYRSVRAQKQRVSHWEGGPRWCTWPSTVIGRPETLEGGSTCPPSHREVQIPSRGGQQVAGRPLSAGRQQCQESLGWGGSGARGSPHEARGGREGS